MSDFRRLKVWEKSHQAVLDVYAASAKFPVAERYGLAAQLRRTAISVPSNIAEGSGRRGDGDFRRFLLIALGSIHEFEYQLLVARELGFLPDQDHQRLTTLVFEIGRMLNGLIARVNRSDGKGAKGTSRSDRKRAA